MQDRRESMVDYNKLWTGVSQCCEFFFFADSFSVYIHLQKCSNRTTSIESTTENRTAKYCDCRKRDKRPFWKHCVTYTARTISWLTNPNTLTKGHGIKIDIGRSVAIWSFKVVATIQMYKNLAVIP